MAGEQLPPVVATLDIDDSGFLSGLDDSLAAVRSWAAEVESLLASLDVGAGLADSLAGANLGGVNTDEITQGLSEQMGGVGEAMAEDLGSEFTRSLTSIGVDGGEELALGVESSVSGVGASVARSIGQDVAGVLPDRMAEVGDAAGGELVAGLTAAAQAGQAGSVVGRVLGAAVGIDAAAEAGAAAGGSFATSLVDAAAGDLTARSLTSISGPLAAAATDLAAEAGGAGGSELARALADTAGEELSTVAISGMGGSLTAAAVDVGAEAGAAGGSMFGQVFADTATEVVGPSIAELTAVISEQLRVGLDEAAQANRAVLGQMMAQGPTSAAGPAAMGAEAGQQVAEAYAGGVAAGASEVSAAADGLTEQMRTSFEVDDALAAQLAQMLPRPFVSAYMDIRAGLEIAQSDFDAMSTSMIDRLGELNLMIEESGVAAADAAAAAVRFVDPANMGYTQVPTQAPDEFVPDPLQTNHYILQSAADAQAAAQAAAEAAAEDIPTAFDSAVSRAMGIVTGDLVAEVTADAGEVASAFSAAVGEAMAVAAPDESGMGAAMIAGMFPQADMVAQVTEGFSAQLAGAMQDVAAGLEVSTETLTYQENYWLGEFTSMLTWNGQEAAFAWAAAMAQLTDASGLAGLTNLSPELSDAFQKAYAGVEADTSAFTASMKSALSSFTMVMEMQGAEAAQAFAAGINMKDPASMNIAPPQYVQLAPEATDTEAVASGVSDIAASADKATGAVGGLAEIMYGPLGMALYGLMAVGPSVVGWIQNLTGTSLSATDSAADLELSLTSVGGSADQLSPSLLAMSGDLGIAANQLGSSVGQLQNMDQALANLYATNPALAASDFTQIAGAMGKAGVSASALATDFPKYTAAVQQAEIAQQLLGIEINELVPGTQAFTDAVGKQTLALQLNAANALVNATALNNNLPPQAQLSGAAVTAATDFQNAGSAVSQYTTALNSLYGQYGTTNNALATFTTDLSGLNGNISHGKDAVDLLSDAGAKNFHQFEQTWAQAQTYSNALYAQTQSAGQAQQALQTMLGAIDQTAAHAGLTAAQIQTLNMDLANVPQPGAIVFQSNAPQVLSEIQLLNQAINPDYNIPPDIAAPHARAAGGPVEAGNTYWVGEQGPELVTFGASGYVTPADMLQPAQLGAPLGGAGAYGGGNTYNIVNVSTGPMLSTDAAVVAAVQTAMTRLGMRSSTSYTPYQASRARSS